MARYMIRPVWLQMIDAFKERFLHEFYYYHLYHRGDAVELRTGLIFGKGKLIAEMPEDGLGENNPELIKQNLGKIGKRRFAPSRQLNQEVKIGTRIWLSDLEYRPDYPKIGQIWVMEDDIFPNGSVYKKGYSLMIIEPVQGTHFASMLCKNLETGEPMTVTVREFIAGHYKRKGLQTTRKEKNSRLRDATEAHISPHHDISSTLCGFFDGS